MITSWGFICLILRMFICVGAAVSSLRVILVGKKKKSSWPLVLLVWWEPAYTCSHPQFAPWGQAHGAGWGCCQTARSERHCQVSLTLAWSPIGPCHWQEAGSASLHCHRLVGCSLPPLPNSLRQCQHQLALGEASVSEAFGHCQLNWDFQLFASQGLAAAVSRCGSSWKWTTCWAWPRSNWSGIWAMPVTCTCPWGWPWPPWWPWLWPLPEPGVWVHRLSPWSRWPLPWCLWPWWWPWWQSCLVSSCWGAVCICASVFGVHSCRVSVGCGGGGARKKNRSYWENAVFIWVSVTSCSSYLVCTLATDRIAVGVFDRSLHMAVSNNGVGKWNSVSETATPVSKWTEKHCK